MRPEFVLLLVTVACAALIPVRVTAAYGGLPAHPLLLHVPVILIPVVLVCTLLRAFAPRRIDRYAVALAALTVFTLASTVLTASTGEALRHALGLDRPGTAAGLAHLIARHAHAAAILRLLMFGLSFSVILDLLAYRVRQGQLLQWPRANRLMRLPATSQTLAVAMVFLTVATGYFVFRTGDLGARAVWAGRLDSGGTVPPNARASVAANPVGARVFASAGCASCHTLAAAGARGNVGANLDSLRPDAFTVTRLVTAGGSGMPSFANTLSAQQIHDVAKYVSTVAGAYGSSVPVFKPDNTALASCGRFQTFGCYEQAFGNLTYREGPKPALALYQKDMSSIHIVDVDCHRIAHAMGAAALLRFKGDVGQAIAAGSALCGSGYYHGIMERALIGTRIQGLASVARRLCSNSSVSSNEFLTYQCIHGLGHGLMIYTGDDLPLSLKTCDQLQTRWDQLSCSGGVFMENFTTFYKVRTHWVSSKDLLYPCDAVTVRYKYYCYDLVTAHILPAVHWNWKRAADVCWHAEKAWIAECFRSYGRDAWSTTGPSASWALRLCRLAGSMQRECDFSVGLQIANDTAKLAPAAAFCNRTVPGVRSYCFKGMGVTASVLAPGAEALNACASVAGRYTLACFKGAEEGAVPAAAEKARATGRIFSRT